MLLNQLFEAVTRTGKGNTAVVGWGRGMGHKGHMMLASSVITKAKEAGGDPYFVVSRTVGKDDPITPEEKLAIYKKVFPEQGHIFQAASDEIPDLTRVLANLNKQGYKNCIVVVGADQVKAFQYLKKYNGHPDKAGNVAFEFDNLDVISRQETSDPSAGEEGPRATPMRQVLNDPNKSDEEQFSVWRDAMSPEISDNEVRDLMNKAKTRMGAFAKPKKKGVSEGKVKDLMMDLKELSDSEFQQKYHMSKAEAREGVAESMGDKRTDPAPSKEFVSNKFYVKFTPNGIEFTRRGELVYTKPGDYSNPTRGDYNLAKGITTELWRKEQQGVAEGGFFDQDRPNIGDVVKHKHSGAMGRVKKIGTQGDTTTVYFKDAKTGAMNYGEWKKHVFPIKKQGMAEGSAQNTPQQAKVRAAIVAGMKSSDEFNAAKVAAAGVARDKSVAINGPAGQYKYIPLRRQGGFASNSIDSIDRIEPDGTVVMNLVGNATHPDIRWIKTLLAQGGIPGAEVVNYYPDITATDEVVRQIIGNVGAGLGRNEFMNQLQLFLNAKYDGQQVKGAMRNADLLWAKYTDLKQGMAEGSFGSGYGRVFTLYVNTGEKPPTKTKTKKFKREDDAVAWAEDYADTHDQYPTLQMEIKDDNGGVVWELEESQGVAEVSNTTLRSYSKKAEKELATPGAPVKQNRVDGVVRAANKRYAKDSEEVYGKVKESLRRGEYYVHTVHFADGETGQIKTHNDEQTDDSIKAFYAKQGKDVVKVDYNWGIQGEQDY